MKLSSSQRRRAFSIIELLVVIAIIGILAALIAGATMRVIGVQQQKNTELLVQKLGASTTAAWQAAFDRANNEPIPDAAFSQLLTQAGSPAGARAAWVQLRLQQQFPMTVAEATNPVGGLINPEPAYAPLATAGVAGTPQESAACLYMALKNNRQGQTFDPDTLSPRELTITSTPTVKYFIDEWKVPLQFQRQTINGQVVPVISSTGSPSGVTISSQNLRIGGYSGG